MRSRLNLESNVPDVDSGSDPSQARMAVKQSTLLVPKMMLFLKRFVSSPRGRWVMLAVVIGVFFGCLVVISNIENIVRTVRLPEWNIYRFDCLSPPKRSLSSTEPLYISHNFHPKVGLGNLMFIYASLWAIAKRSGLKPTINHTKLHDAFHIDLPAEHFFDLSDCNNFVLGMEECCMYDVRTEHISQLAPGQNVSLWGYFQSWRYFHPEFEKDIRRQFAFRSDINRKAEDIVEKFRSESGDKTQARPMVGIHIRRGDVTDEASLQFGHTVPTREYFAHAMDYLKTKGVIDPIYIVCTNDIEWSRQNLVGFDIHFVEDEGPYVDMAVLVKMDHLILSTGTYTFFAGYLSSARNVIYYKNYPRPGSDFARMTDLASFWLPEWVAME